jgi:K+-sensing histidine kinase KdpD
LILSNSFKYIKKSNVHIDVSEELPSVKADSYWLSTAIINLLEPSAGYFYNTEFTSLISAQRKDDTHVLVRICTGLELSTDENYNSIESISSPGNSLSVAGIILNKHGSHLEFSPLKRDDDKHKSQGTEFRFTLPLWE